MATVITRSQQWRAWKGTATEVGAVLAVADSHVRDGASDSERVHVSITAEAPDVQDEFDDVASFQDYLSRGDFAKLRKIRSHFFSLGERGDLEVSLWFDTTAGSAVHLTVKGGDVDAVEGARAVLASRLKAGERRLLPSWISDYGFFAILGPLLILDGLQWFLDHHHHRHAARIVSTAAIPVAGLFGVTMIALVVQGLIIPRLEILLPGGEPRTKRVTLTARRTGSG